MTTMPLEQKVRQLDNDVQALYDLVHRISTTQVRHSNRFDEITTDLAAHGQRLDRIEGRLGGIDGRLDGIDGRLDGIDGRLDGLDGRLDGLEGKVDQVLELLQR